MPSSASRPSHVKIGARKWKIVWSETAWIKYKNIAGETLDPEEMGKTYMRTGVIAIRSKKIPDVQLQQEVLVHEISHAIHYGIGWPYSFTFVPGKGKDDFIVEESLVSITSPLWLGIFKENPAVVVWLTS